MQMQDIGYINYLKSTLTHEDKLREEQDLGTIPVPFFHHDYGRGSTILSLLQKLFPALQELSI